MAIAIFVGLTGTQACDIPEKGLLKSDSKAVAIRQDGLAETRAELEARITSAPAQVMKTGGLAGAMGGARVRVTFPKLQEIMPPVPQLTGGQVPLFYSVAVTPAAMASGFRLLTREARSSSTGRSRAYPLLLAVLSP